VKRRVKLYAWVVAVGIHFVTIKKQKPEHRHHHDERKKARNVSPCLREHCCMCEHSTTQQLGQ
jgi:hypothetical protein